MSKLVEINSPAQFSELLGKSKIVVADFYADWCGPCHQIAPLYEQLANSMSKENVVTFTKINTDRQKEVAAAYSVSAMPTFMVFRDGNVVEKVQGADPKRLMAVVQKLGSEVEKAGSSGESSSAGGSWRGADVAKGYKDVTDQVEIPRCELLNVDDEKGGVRVLFKGEKPGGAEKDWVESDTDEQLMLFMPFQSMIKLHSLQITSLPPTDEDDAPMRPKVLKIYSNKPHNLGFDEAEDTAATQEIDIQEDDWKNGTVNIPLRFVKFQNINSIVIFVVSGDGDSEKVRIDRLRLVGETGEKREMGKLEKVGEHDG